MNNRSLRAFEVQISKDIERIARRVEAKKKEISNAEARVQKAVDTVHSDRLTPIAGMLESLKKMVAVYNNIHRTIEKQQDSVSLGGQYGDEDYWQEVQGVLVSYSRTHHNSDIVFKHHINRLYVQFVEEVGWSDVAGTQYTQHCVW